MIIQSGFNPTSLPTAVPIPASQLNQTLPQNETSRPVVPTTQSEAAAQKTQSEKKTEERRAEDRKREAAGGSEKSITGEALTEDEQQKVEELKQRDQEVRQHELAHKAVAGQYARGGVSFSYERGPDGRNYATGGEVNIDTSKVPNDPEATLRKAEVIERAATAPQEPSSQDRKVAAEARQMATEARGEIAEQRAADRVEAAGDAPAEAVTSTNPYAAEGSRRFGINQITANGLFPTVGTQLNVTA